MRKFDKMFLDDVFYNLNSLHKIENGDAPQMQHQAMFLTIAFRTFSIFVRSCAKSEFQ